MPPTGPGTGARRDRPHRQLRLHVPGSSYYPYGIHRPTSNSLMRGPGRQGLQPPRARGHDRRLLPRGQRTEQRYEEEQRGPQDRCHQGLRPNSPAWRRRRLRWYIDGVQVRRAQGLTAVTPAGLARRRQRGAHRDGQVRGPDHLDPRPPGPRGDRREPDLDGEAVQAQGAQQTLTPGGRTVRATGGTGGRWPRHRPGLPGDGAGSAPVRVAARVPQPRRDGGVGEVVPYRFMPGLAAQAEDPRPPQLAAAHGRVEHGPDRGPRAGVLALDDESRRAPRPAVRRPFARGPAAVTG